MNSITNLTLNELRRGLVDKKFSSTELTESLLDRAEALSELNCFVELNRERALQAAKQADDRLAAGEQTSLLGIPIAVKDIILTKGIRTSCCSKILESFIPPYDATVVTKLKQAGAIVIGKTNMDEFAMGSSNESSCFGPVLNPWDKQRVSGGSSGGSAAAVSAGLAPLALGTDTGGSIRQPASLCGVVGIKPTYGRVSRYGVVAYASSLDQVGVFAKNVSDAAELTTIICGKNKHDSTSMDLDVPDFNAKLTGGIKGLRIGVPREFFVEGINPEVKEKVQAAIGQLAKDGAEIVDISLPHSDIALACYYIIAPAEASSNLARYDGIRFGHRADNPTDLKDLYCRSRSEGFGAEVKRRIMIGTYVLSTGYYDAYYLQAQKVRKLISHDFNLAFSEKCDLIAAPVAPTTAFRLGEKTGNPLEMYLSDIYTIMVNLAGLPALSVPCGFDTAGLPIGLQLIGKPWDEEQLLRTAHAYEQATSWHKERPAC